MECGNEVEGGGEGRLQTAAHNAATGLCVCAALPTCAPSAFQPICLRRRLCWRNPHLTANSDSWAALCHPGGGDRGLFRIRLRQRRCEGSVAVSVTFGSSSTGANAASTSVRSRPRPLGGSPSTALGATSTGSPSGASRSVSHNSTPKRPQSTPLALPGSSAVWRNWVRQKLIAVLRLGERLCLQAYLEQGTSSIDHHASQPGGGFGIHNTLRTKRAQLYHLCTGDADLGCFPVPYDVPSPSLAPFVRALPEEPICIGPARLQLLPSLGMPQRPGVPQNGNPDPLSEHQTFKGRLFGPLGPQTFVQEHNFSAWNIRLLLR